MPRRRPPQEWIEHIQRTDDGIRPVRDAHDWSREKLVILARYFEAYTTACGRTPCYFVDGMAGPGLYFIRERSQWLLGSTLIALESRPPFRRTLSLEFEATVVEALRARVARYGNRAAVERGDVNADLAPHMEQHIPRRGPSFVLLDPEGAELHWSTVEAASAHRRDPRGLKSELLILFATEGVNRMLPVEANIELHNEMALNKMFPPTANWRGTWIKRRSGEVTPAEARLDYVEQYMEGLRQLGYKHVLRREITRSSGALVYHLVFASDHDAGERIMNYVFETTYANRDQLPLL